MTVEKTTAFSAVDYDRAVLPHLLPPPPHCPSAPADDTEWGLFPAQSLLPPLPETPVPAGRGRESSQCLQPSPTRSSLLLLLCPSAPAWGKAGRKLEDKIWQELLLLDTPLPDSPPPPVHSLTFTLLGHVRPPRVLTTCTAPLLL